MKKTKIKEMSKRFLFSKKDILSEVARWGILQSPYDRPENIEIVIDKLNKIITPFFKQDEEFQFLRLSYEEIIKFVFKHTTAIPEFEAWNEPKIASDHPLVGTSSRFHTTKPDYDYIDLHALARNVTNSIIRKDYETPIPLILQEKEIKN